MGVPDGFSVVIDGSVDVDAVPVVSDDGIGAKVTGLPDGQAGRG